MASPAKLLVGAQDAVEKAHLDADPPGAVLVGDLGTARKPTLGVIVD